MENENKLIAEFMGYIIDYGFKKDAILYMPQGEGNASNNAIHLKLDKVKYHTSWDWLMPVVDKCYNSNMQHPNDDITQGLIDVDIDSTYQAVVEFIKFYNQNK